MITYNLKVNSLLRKIHCGSKTFSARKFLAVMSSGYQSWLGDKGYDGPFLTIEPESSELNKLLSKNTEVVLFNSFEYAVTELLRDLVLFGRAYLLIHPEYITETDDDGIEHTELNSLEIGSISGYIKKQNDTSYIFCAVAKYDKSVHVDAIPKDLLVKLDLKDIGFSSRYFYRMIKILNKYDITMFPDFLHYCYGYNFTEHYKAVKLIEMKALKEVGWVDKENDLLKSYKLYNQIKMNKLRIQLLKYVVKKINEGLKSYLKEATDGELVPHIRLVDYDKRWCDYSNGKITLDQLQDLVY